MICYDNLRKLADHETTNAVRNRLMQSFEKFKSIIGEHALDPNNRFCEELGKHLIEV